MYFPILALFSAAAVLASTIPPVDRELADRDSAPAPKPALALRQATREQIITEHERRRRGVVKRQTSATPATCVADTTAATNGYQGAVFSNSLVTSNDQSLLTSETAASAADCNRLSQQYSLSTFGYYVGGLCQVYSAPQIQSIDSSPGDTIIFVDATCQAAKQLYPSAASLTCCNLYY